jgi:hypothetical protein
MVTTKEVLRQFHQLRVKPSRWAKGEIAELANILVPGERITHVVFGWYDNGFGLLCCTEHRVLLIDKKIFYLKMEDLRYDKISEVRFLNRLLDSSVILSYAGMKLEFKTWNQSALRKLTDYVQQTITMINQQQWQVTPSPSIERLQPVPQEPVEYSLPAQPVIESAAISQGLSSYPDELMSRAAIDLGLMKNPYAPTNKYMRRRTPLYGFNQSSR